MNRIEEGLDENVLRAWGTDGVLLSESNIHGIIYYLMHSSWGFKINFHTLFIGKIFSLRVRNGEVNVNIAVKFKLLSYFTSKKTREPFFCLRVKAIRIHIVWGEFKGKVLYLWGIFFSILFVFYNLVQIMGEDAMN